MAEAHRTGGDESGDESGRQDPRTPAPRSLEHAAQGSLPPHGIQEAGAGLSFAAKSLPGLKRVVPPNAKQ